MWKQWEGQQGWRLGVAGKRAPGAWWQNLFHKCGEVSSAPGHMVIAGWHLFVMLTGWQNCELRNWPPPKSQTSLLPRLSVAWRPAGEIRCWGSSEKLYYGVTCKGVGTGETMTRWQAGKPGEETKCSFQLSEAQWCQSDLTDHQARSVELEPCLLTYQGLAPHQSV